MYLFIFGCIGFLLLRASFLSSCSERGLHFVAVHRLPFAVASLFCGARAPGTWASVVVAHRLSGSSACEIFQDQGLNLCPLHWPADS